MRVEMNDDFDLDKIIKSGQCFRGMCFDSHNYRFVTGEHVIYMQRETPNLYIVSCTSDEWERIWTPFFDLHRSYSEISFSEMGKHPFVDKALAYGSGLRILRQDSWEMLITFIISQRKSIPAITKSVEKLSSKFGHDIITEKEIVKSFPSAEEMKYAAEDELAECGLGYRTKYVLDAVRRVNNGILNLASLNALPDNLLLEELQTVCGVGKKVANCVALFAYGRMSCVPVDVWISRAIADECEGVSPFSLYGDMAGIIQQYVFYYERNAIGRKD